jgi:hypothetical protein
MMNISAWFKNHLRHLQGIVASGHCVLHDEVIALLFSLFRTLNMCIVLVE